MKPVGAIRKVMTSATTNPVVMAPRTEFSGFMEILRVKNFNAGKRLEYRPAGRTGFEE